MKIHILPVNPEFQPQTQNYVCPPHNQQWNVCKDFLAWLGASGLATDNPDEADWDYLPIFWNAYYINNAWGQKGGPELQAEIERLVCRSRATFTITEYDIDEMQPELDLCEMVTFEASRRNQTGIDIPLLCSRHVRPDELPAKQWRACFAGNAGTWNERFGMRDLMSSLPGVNIVHGQNGTEFFVRQMLESWIALAPRGHGSQSFRFYEAMDLGVVPLFIGDIDSRPFKRWINWDECSLYAAAVDDAIPLLDTPVKRLEEMGWWARQVYEHDLMYGQWCRYVIKELERL